jgi:phage shock protein A
MEAEAGPDEAVRAAVEAAEAALAAAHRGNLEGLAATYRLQKQRHDDQLEETRREAAEQKEKLKAFKHAVKRAVAEREAEHAALIDRLRAEHASSLSLGASPEKGHREPQTRSEPPVPEEHALLRTWGAKE